MGFRGESRYGLAAAAIGLSAFEAGELATGLGAAAAGAETAALRGAAKEFKAIPKPPRGPGSVPKADRDPKRFFSPSEREAKRAEQGNLCGNGCGKEIDGSNSAGHHTERHADGGRTVPENHVEVCVDCHKDIHSGDE